MITIDGLGEFGIIKDLQPHRLPPNAWSDGLNVRFRNGEVGRTQGDVVIDTIDADPLYMLPLQYDQEYYWIICTANFIYRWDGQNLVNISPLSDSVLPGNDLYPSADLFPSANTYLEFSAERWNGGVVSGVVGLNPGGAGRPVYYTPEMDNCEVFPGWPDNWTAKVLRPYRNFWIAGNFKEAGINYPTRYRWSAAAEPGSIPTEWIASASNDAGEDVLEESQGEIVDFHPLRDYLMLYKEDATALLQYVGGAFVISNRVVFKSRGILATECVTEFNSKHFVVTQGDIVVHDGQNVDSIVEGKNRRAIFDSIDVDNVENCFVVPNYKSEEIWFCYPSGTTYASRAAIWNWRSGVWAFRELANISHIAYGLIPELESPLKWNTVNEKWNTINRRWNEKTFNPAEQSLLLAQPVGGSELHPDVDLLPSASLFPNQGRAQLIQIDVGTLFGGANAVRVFLYPSATEYPKPTLYPASGDETKVKFVSYIERRGLKPGNKDGVFMCRAVYPRGTGGSIKVTVGSQDSPTSQVRWGTPQLFSTGGTADKVDVRVTGRYLAVRFDLYDSAKLFGADYDVVQVGAR